MKTPIRLTDEQLADVLRRAVKEGFWSLSGDEMEGYRNAWREGRAEQWRATVRRHSTARDRSTVDMDAFGVTQAECIKRVSALLAEHPGSAVVTAVHKATVTVEGV